MVDMNKFILFAILCVVHSVHSNAISQQSVLQHIEPHEYKKDDHHYGALHHIGDHKPNHQEEYAASFPSYEFSYKVDDPHTGDQKSHYETRHGDVVKGEYSLVEPDGNIRTVKYYADDHSGFNAIVHYLSPHNHVKFAKYPHQSNKEHKDDKHYGPQTDYHEIKYIKPKSHHEKDDKPFEIGQQYKKEAEYQNHVYIKSDDYKNSEKYFDTDKNKHYLKNEHEPRYDPNFAKLNKIGGGKKQNNDHKYKDEGLHIVIADHQNEFNKEDKQDLKPEKHSKIDYYGIKYDNHEYNGEHKQKDYGSYDDKREYDMYKPQYDIKKTQPKERYYNPIKLNGYRIDKHNKNFEIPHLLDYRNKMKYEDSKKYEEDYYNRQ